MCGRTPTVPIVTDQAFGWGPVPNALAFLGLGLFTLVGVLLTGAVLSAGVHTSPVLVCSAVALLLHQVAAYVAPGYVFRAPLTFLGWAGVLAVSYAALNGAIGASLTRTLERAGGAADVGFWMGVLGCVDALGSAVGPLLLDTAFGASDEGAAMTSVLAVSRGAAAVPTAVILAVFAVRLAWDRTEERAGVMV